MKVYIFSLPFEYISITITTCEVKQLIKDTKTLHSNKSLNNDQKIKKSKLNYTKIIISIFFILCILLIIFTFPIYNFLNKINKVTIDKSDLIISENIPKEESAIVQNDDIKSIAIFGIDEAEGTAGRSDCIMILTLDNKHNKIKLLSVIRDSYVVIPTKEKKDKINHAYAFGGPHLALKTLNENFDLNLNQFVSVNFSYLPKLIDNVDGITLNITTDELKYINDYINNLNYINKTTSPNITTAGIQKVDGTQALAYCRIRYTDGGDFERSQRHRTVINQLIEKCKITPKSQYPSLLEKLLPLVQTNLESSEILSLAVNLNSLKDQQLLQDRFPKDDDASGKNIDGVYYYVFNKEPTIQKIHQFIYN